MTVPRPDATAALGCLVLIAFGLGFLLGMVSAFFLGWAIG